MWSKVPKSCPLRASDPVHRRTAAGRPVCFHQNCRQARKKHMVFAPPQFALQRQQIGALQALHHEQAALDQRFQGGLQGAPFAFHPTARNPLGWLSPPAGVKAGLTAGEAAPAVSDSNSAPWVCWRDRAKNWFQSRLYRYSQGQVCQLRRQAQQNAQAMIFCPRLIQACPQAGVNIPLENSRKKFRPKLLGSHHFRAV